ASRSENGSAGRSAELASTITTPSYHRTPVPQSQFVYRKKRHRLLQLRDLDQVAAGVVEHGGDHRAHVGWFLREQHTKLPQPAVLGGDVVHGKGCDRDAVADQG